MKEIFVIGLNKIGKEWEMQLHNALTGESWTIHAKRKSDLIIEAFFNGYRDVGSVM